jgi:FkbM family methyltransferase
VKALQLLKTFSIRPIGIIHVGANDGNESPAYAAAAVDVCVYVEPIPTVFAQLEKQISRFPGHVAIQALCTDRDGEVVKFNVASNNGRSSSILPLGDHAEKHPDIKYVSAIEIVGCTLDSLLAKHFPDVRFNLLVIDVQGAELRVLKGAPELLKTIDAVFLEVSDCPLYEGCCRFEDIEAFFKPLGYMLKWMEIGPYGYGDAFFLRKRSVAEPGVKNIALGKPAKQSSQSAWSRPNDAQGGNNGIRTGRYSFHTNLEPSPWWQVDLTRTADLSEIRVFNRIDTSAERADNLLIMISEDGQEWRPLYQSKGLRFGGIDGRPLIVPVQEAKARFVRVQLEGTQYLHLDEIEVYEHS